MKKELILKGQKCTKCKYQWFSKVDKPKQCPNCKSMNWKNEKVEIDNNKLESK